MDKKLGRTLLHEGDLRRLFIEVLGWDQHKAALDVAVSGVIWTLNAVAQKRGMVAWECRASPGTDIPPYAIRRKIERQVGRAAHEHLTVFTDSKLETQIWQWVRREPGQPEVCREHLFNRTQSGDALLQKLQAIAFSLDEEDRLSLTDVANRTRMGFDVERVTKRFYDQFKKEHDSFLRFISGISKTEDKEWYASVMLNRLMFVYFIQRKGFLDGDTNYLRNRLARMRAEHGHDQFHSFYRYFLLHLFHEGLGAAERTPQLHELLGEIPYLNGGLFDIHELEKPERYGSAIQISDQAFERVFDYFDSYQWHLDERPLRGDDEINPDVLGYIFEKYVNQKQMGAYYTKEDITEFISKSTLLPHLLDVARAQCNVAFENDRGPTVWELLKKDPDRYIFPALRHGVAEAVPPEIASGIAPDSLSTHVSAGPVETVALRSQWNKVAPESHALNTETWRDVLERRKNYLALRDKLQSGTVSDTTELVALNVDIRQFVQDAIETCEGPDLLRAFWNGIEGVTVLDPMCGSGAFLFAALNVLEPLYDACLTRMAAFIADSDLASQKTEEKFGDFRSTLADVDAHQNHRYFVLKSIILKNLYGVDLMQEAVEICKLRLFLKLAAQAEPDLKRANNGIEPLPDIDFNIRTGNSLVGYATYEDAKEAIAGRLDFDRAMDKITRKAADLEDAFESFRARQVANGPPAGTADKDDLRLRLDALTEELDSYLATEYGVSPSKPAAFSKWISSHQPFHWFVEFFGTMKRGGFDVIIGNPPYVEYKDVKDEYLVKGYATEECGNLFAFASERSIKLASSAGKIGLIIPVASISTEGYSTLRSAWLSTGDLVISSFNDRPGKLFDGLEHIRLAIVLLFKSDRPTHSVHTTRYMKWATSARSTLFDTLHFTDVTKLVRSVDIPKLGSTLEVDVLTKVNRVRKTLAHFAVKSGRGRILYTRKLSGFVQILSFAPIITDAKGHRREPSELKTVSLPTTAQADAFLCALNATLFYWLLTLWSDCRNLNKREVLSVPLDFDALPANARSEFQDLAMQLTADFKRNADVLEMNYAKWGRMKIQCIYPKLSKPVIDRIDTALGRHFGFNEEELDFLLNFDIKFRLGRELEDKE